VQHPTSLQYPKTHSCLSKHPLYTQPRPMWQRPYETACYMYMYGLAVLTAAEEHMDWLPAIDVFAASTPARHPTGL
jgi:hypothetical protein